MRERKLVGCAVGEGRKLLVRVDGRKKVEFCLEFAVGDGRKKPNPKLATTTKGRLKRGCFNKRALPFERELQVRVESRVNRKTIL